MQHTSNTYTLAKSSGYPLKYYTGLFLIDLHFLPYILYNISAHFDLFHICTRSAQSTHQPPDRSGLIFFFFISSKIIWLLWWNCHHTRSIFQTRILTLYFICYTLFYRTFIQLLLVWFITFSNLLIWFPYTGHSIGFLRLSSLYSRSPYHPLVQNYMHKHQSTFSTPLTASMSLLGGDPGSLFLALVHRRQS